VILIPEIPYDIDSVVRAILNRERRGKRLSIVAVAEGARPLAAVPEAESVPMAEGVAVSADPVAAGAPAPGGDDEGDASGLGVSAAARLAVELQHRTGIDARFTSLGHVQRGGTPSARDRLLATRLGTTCVQYIERGILNVMVALQGDGCVPVPLEEVAGKRKLLPLDHPWIESARRLGTNLGD